MQTAARADQQQSWPEGLRISEVAETPSDSLGRAQATPYAELLRGVLAHLRAGWKWLESKRTQQLASRRLRLAETISLGEKRSVSIVQVDGAQYLIGCSASSVQLLAVLDQQDSGMIQCANQERAS